MLTFAIDPSCRNWSRRATGRVFQAQAEVQVRTDNVTMVLQDILSSYTNLQIELITLSILLPFLAVTRVKDSYITLTLL